MSVKIREKKGKEFSAILNRRRRHADALDFERERASGVCRAGRERRFWQGRLVVQDERRSREGRGEDEEKGNGGERRTFNVQRSTLNF
jgi:hypothetical protein